MGRWNIPGGPVFPRLGFVPIFLASLIFFLFLSRPFCSVDVSGESCLLDAMAGSNNNRSLLIRTTRHLKTVIPRILLGEF
jgi:hypothetical protein